METYLLLNGYEITASIDEQESVILGVAAGHLNRDEFFEWIEAHLTEIQ
jgi:death-on-curing protein